MIRTFEIEIEGQAPSEFRLFKSGINETKSGPVVIDDDAIRAALTEYEAHGIDLMIDWMHRSLDEGASADDGEAAGWFALEARDGELWAVDVRWTDEAREKIEAKKFRYFSPAIIEDDAHRLQRVINVALTNLPAMSGIEPLVLQEEIGMKKLLAAVDAVDEDTAIAKIAELYSMIEALTARVAELEGEKELDEKEDMISELSQSGKLTPSMGDFLRTLSVSQIKTYAERAPVIAPQPAHVESTAKQVLSETEQRVIRQLGVSEEQYLASRSRVTK